MEPHCTIQDGTLLFCFTSASCQELRLPSGIRKIGELALMFAPCSKLILPESCTALDKKALVLCKASEIVLSETLQTIGPLAFAHCVFRDISLPEGIVEFPFRVFHQCTNLETLRLPASLQKIRSLGALPALKTIEVAEGNRSFRSDGTSLFSKDGKTLFRVVSNLAGTYTIPEGVTEIAGDAFAYCTGLTDIIIPDSVTRIGIGAFSYCSSLTALRFPDGIQCIPSETCEHCSSLKKVHFPASLTELGDRAFYEVPLQEIFLPEGLLTLGSHVFKAQNIEALVIPSTLQETPERVLVYEYLHRLIYRPRSMKHLRSIGCAIDLETLVPGRVEEIVLAKPQLRFLSGLPEALMAPICRGYVHRHNNGKALTAKEMQVVAELSHIAKWDCWADPEVGPFLLTHKLISLEDYAEASWGIERYFDTLADMDQPGYLDDFLSEYDNYAAADQRKIRSHQNELGCIPFAMDSSDDFSEYEASLLFEWMEQRDGTVRITGYIGIFDEVTVPKFINGVPVTSIGPCAFTAIDEQVSAWHREVARRLTSVILPCTIREIDHRVFCGCENLEWVTVLEDDEGSYPLDTLGVEVFRDCTSLERILLPEGVEKIQDGCFQGCTSLEKIIVPGSIRELPPRAFADCDNLQRVTLMEGVSKVDISAFSGCTNLTELQLPASLKLQDWSPFADCPVETVIAPAKAAVRSLAADRGIRVIPSSTTKRKKK